MATNYNRDVEVFPVLSKILKQITNEDVYNSPTDMGVNMIGFCITDDEVARKVANAEIVRRYYRALVDFRNGYIEENVLNKMQAIMNKAGVSINDRKQ